MKKRCNSANSKIYFELVDHTLDSFYFIHYIKIKL